MIIDKEQYYLDIMNAIDLMDGHDFECFCAILLINNGFRDVSVTQNSGDYGIDILARYHNQIYGIQCKRYLKPVGIDAIRDTLGGYDYYKCDTIAVLTNSTFTPQAVNQAKVSGVRLWDREYLVNNLIDTCEDIDFIEQILKDETDICEAPSYQGYEDMFLGKINQRRGKYTNIDNNHNANMRKVLSDMERIDVKDADNILKEKAKLSNSMEVLEVNSEIGVYNKKVVHKKTNHKQVKVKDYTVCNEGIYISNKICTRNFVNIFGWFCLISGIVICMLSLLLLIIDIILGISSCLLGVCCILYGFKIKKVIKLYDRKNSKK